jgi:hypothetical protein
MGSRGAKVCQILLEDHELHVHERLDGGGYRLMQIEPC